MSVNLSTMALDEGRYDDAESFARSALKIDSLEVSATFNLGKSLVLRNEIEAGLPYLSKATQAQRSGSVPGTGSGPV